MIYQGELQTVLSESEDWDQTFVQQTNASRSCAVEVSHGFYDLPLSQRQDEDILRVRLRSIIFYREYKKNE